MYTLEYVHVYMYSYRIYMVGIKKDGNAKVAVPFLMAESDVSAENTFRTFHSLHPDYRNVAADTRCGKLENFFSPFLLLRLSSPPPPSYSISLPRCENTTRPRWVFLRLLSAARAAI